MKQLKEKIWLTEGNTIEKAFAVWGYNFIANLIILLGLMAIAVILEFVL